MNKPLTTSIDEIAKHDPCKEGWDALLELRGHESCDIEDFEGDATIFKVSELGELGNVSWMCWTARLFEGDEEKLKIYRLFAIWCANRVRHLMKDDRSLKTLEMASRYINYECSYDELFSARVAESDSAAAAAAAAADAAAAAAASADEKIIQLKKLTESLEQGAFQFDKT